MGYQPPFQNNALTLDQVTVVLGGHHVLAPPKDIREVQNAYEAYDVAAAFDPYSLDDLLKAQKLMMDGLVKHPGCLLSENVGVYAGDVLIDRENVHLAREPFLFGCNHGLWDTIDLFIGIA